MSGDIVNDLRQENATLRRALNHHPAVETLRFLAPFITAAIDAGVWEGNTDAVERELRCGLSLAERMGTP